MKEEPKTLLEEFDSSMRRLKALMGEEKFNKAVKELAALLKEKAEASEKK